MQFCLDNNASLKPYFEIDEKFVHEKIKELVLRYNYTLNPEGIFEAIKYMYTYWPDPHNKTHIREQYIHVSMEKGDGLLNGEINWNDSDLLREIEMYRKIERQIIHFWIKIPVKILCLLYKMIFMYVILFLFMYLQFGGIVKYYLVVAY